SGARQSEIRSATHSKPDVRPSAETLYGALVVKGPLPAIVLFLRQFLWSIRRPVSSPRPIYPQCCRAQGLSRLAVAPTLPRAPSTPGHTLTPPSTAAHLLWSDDEVRGEPRVVHEYSCHILVFGGC